MTIPATPVDTLQVEKILAKLDRIKTEITELESECIALLSSGSVDESQPTANQECDIADSSSSEVECPSTFVDAYTHQHLPVLAARHQQKNAEFATVSNETPDAAGIVARLTAYGKITQEKQVDDQEIASNDAYSDEGTHVLSGRHIGKLKKGSATQVRVSTPPAKLITLATWSRRRAPTPFITVNKGRRTNSRVDYLGHAVMASVIVCGICVTAQISALSKTHNAGYAVSSHSSQRIQHRGVEMLIAAPHVRRDSQMGE